MPSIRTAYTVVISGASDTIPAPGNARPGDVIHVFQGVDEGSVGQMGISGGPAWSSPYDLTPIPGQFVTKVHRRMITSSEPDEYEVTQAPGSVGVATVLVVRDASSSVVIAGESLEAWDGGLDGVATPGANPAFGSGSNLDVRVSYAFGYGNTDWDDPSGYMPITSGNTGYVAAHVAARALYSSSPVGPRTFETDGYVAGSAGYTLIFSQGEAVPPPPPPPGFTPGLGISPYRYTAHDLLTGDYITDVELTNVHFDRRIGEPGTFSAMIPLANPVQAAKARKIVPRKSSDLSTGPGRTTIRIWRDGDLWGEYWLHGARPGRSRRGTETITLRGSTLDAYILNTQMDLPINFTGEQFANFRALLAHLQGDFHADIGLALTSGSSSVIRPLTAQPEDRRTHGAIITAYAREAGENGFEFYCDPRISGTSVDRRIVVGAPRIDTGVVHLFEESPRGGSIVERSEEIDALRAGTRMLARGGTPETTDATQSAVPTVSTWVEATAHYEAGWPRIDRVIDHPLQSTDSGTLDDFAARWINTFAGALRVHSVTVVLGKKTTLTPSSLGDQVRRKIVSVWHPYIDGEVSFDESQRLLGIGITPISRMSGKEEAQLILEEPTL
ncbi:hypothetical protein [Herbidospora mongoliensis]|uniref:hypothetical protein n=1 Tax=Herbidospora mongoliensis TaxID=688067 RepID=UPI000836F858|nr:hypothetical protein [Herbidospora mongoliensis]